VTYGLIVTATAEQHVLDACLYYEEQLSGLSYEFLSELQVTYEKISTHPEYYSFISAKDQFRDIKIYKFPFVVIYEVINDTVVVIAVFNTNRKAIY